MIKRFLCVLCLLLVFSLSSGLASAEETKDANAYAQFCEGRLFADELPEEALPRPNRCIASLEDFIYALDYLAFYRIGDAVYFDIDPSYAETFFNPYTDFQKAYQQSDLADVYACHLEDSFYSSFRVVALKYSMSRDIASEPPEQIPDRAVIPSFDYVPSGDHELVIPIERSGKQPVPCENGEQLYYLAMNGYRPVPREGSVAQTLYDAACTVIRKRIRDDQSDFEKIKAVYDYLTSEVLYDRETAYSAETYLVREQAYYLEGVFLNHCAVCDGKAKAYALLLNMLGIPCYRETGVSEYGDHAWNVVRLDGKWYVSCSTYGQSNVAALDRILPNYATLLAGRETAYGDEWGYIPQKHPEIYAQLEETAYDVYGAMGAVDGLNLKVAALPELTVLLDEIDGQCVPEYKVEFVYSGADSGEFQEEMIQYLSSLPAVNAMEVKSEGGTVYQVIYLTEQ